MGWAPDTSDKWAPDSGSRDTWALDSSFAGITLGSAIDDFLTAKAAEGSSPKTLDWYRMVLGRARRDLGPDRPLDSLTLPQLRSWLLTLRTTLAPISVAGYVRGLKAFGNWCAAEELAEARALRTLRRPQVPHKLVEPLDDAAVRRMLDAASLRDRAIVLLMLDTGLRLSEVAGLRRCDLRPDGTVKVLGKGARERIVPVGNIARQALVRHLRDVEPTPFDEWVSSVAPAGLPASMIYVGNDPFISANPFDFLTAPLTGIWEAAGPEDQGIAMDLDLGEIEPGASVTFTLYLGAAESRAAAEAAIATVDMDWYSLGIPDTAGAPSTGTPNTFVFGYQEPEGLQLLMSPDAPSSLSVGGGFNAGEQPTMKSLNTGHD